MNNIRNIIRSKGIKMTGKKIIEYLILIPNSPIYIILATIIFIKIYIHTPIHEHKFIFESDDLITEEIADWIDRVYPIVVQFILTVCFYCFIVALLIVQML